MREHNKAIEIMAHGYQHNTLMPTPQPTPSGNGKNPSPAVLRRSTRTEMSGSCMMVKKRDVFYQIEASTVYILVALR